MEGKATSNTGKKAVIYLRVSTARQAASGGEREGYSIPAQRAACQRKAEELGAKVVDEYVDAGASARSVDRPALQELLMRLRDRRDVDYVIVHKVDRLARDRADDVSIGLTIHKAGAVLVSASEQIDDTPAGTLLHGIMAAIAEFYSKNLSHEAKKGLHEKAKRGGTPGYAPIGYLNQTERVDGREVKLVVPDPERAPHITWAFETYASGDWAISDLVEELARRGLRTRPTSTRAPLPLTKSQIHRMLSSSYYVGKLPYGGMEYEGKHEALVDPQTWQTVQDMLDGRRLGGDRSSKHEQYLKGSLFCARCGSRLGFGYSKGRSDHYGYFFCLGRNKKRTDCDLPYLPLEKAEQHVMAYWQSVKFSPRLIAAIRRSAHEELKLQRANDSQALESQRRRLKKIERQKAKLLDAYLAEAFPVADLKRRQEALAVEEREAERLIQLASLNHEVAEERLEAALGLLEHCARLYGVENEPTRRELNQAFFSAIEIDKEGVKRAILNPPFAQLRDRSIDLADPDDGDGDEETETPDEPDTPRASRPIPETHGQTRTGRTVLARSSSNPEALEPRGSNLTLMADLSGAGLELYYQHRHSSAN